MLLLLAVSGSLNRLAFHAPLLMEPRANKMPITHTAAFRSVAQTA